MLENLMVSSLSGYYSRQERRDAAAVTAFQSLRDELMDALKAGTPQAKVRTPGFPLGEETAAYVVYDSLSSATGDASWHELLNILGAVARGEDGQLRVLTWMRDRSKEHAEYHYGDLLENGELA